MSNYIMVACDVHDKTMVLLIARNTENAVKGTFPNDPDGRRLMIQDLRGHLLAGNELPAVWIPDPATRDDRELVRARLDAGEKLAKKRGSAKNPLGPGGRAALRSLLRQMDSQEQEVADLEKAVVELSATPRYAKPAGAVMALKGVGHVTAMVFLAEIGDLRRFGNRRQLASYLGLVPRTDESGRADDRKGHINRQGPSRVRKVVNQAVWSARAAKTSLRPVDLDFWKEMV